MEALGLSLNAILVLVGLSQGIFMAIQIMYGYWIWDLNKKVGKSVSGTDCESRNNNHYGDTEKLRLEIKNDNDKLVIRFTEGIERSSRERDKSLSTLSNAVEKFMNSTEERHQTNFTAMLNVMKEMGCKNV